jgi:hypothetical protein
MGRMARVGARVWTLAIAAAAAGACDGTITGPTGPDVPAQPIHRLNRLEYNNTVHDLLGTELRPADAFPPDGESDGFDNMAETLQLTPTLLDGYYAAARTVVDDALDDHPAYELLHRHDQLGVPGGYQVGDLWALAGNPVSLQVDVPEGGATVTLLAGAAQVGPAPAPELRMEVDDTVVETFVVAGTAAAIAPHVNQLTLTAGPHTVRYVPTNFVNDAVANTSNNVLVRSLGIESVATVEGPGRDLVFVCDPAAGEAEPCYGQILQTFARRAWRRPLATAEDARLATLWSDLRASGETDDQALRLVMRAILTAPGFIYRARTLRDADSGQWLDDYVLASRLSYFLWSSMPDDRLLAAAADGTLASTDGLTEAVGWMLEDPRAQGLLDGFAEQWLATRLLATASPSPEVYPDFDDELRQAMVEESRQFFADFLRNGEPVTAMLEPDFAYLNDRLATHYAMPPVGSTALVRVSSPELTRTGILSLGAWLTAQSDSTRSSPIRRGRWVSDRILCKPVPPPPAGLEVPPLTGNESGSVREQLEQHRSDPACAGCHSLLDVLGMGFEEFDGIARVRTEAVDTLGELPDGSTFEGASGMAHLVDHEVFASCVTSKLLAYALGRRVGTEDAPDIDAIAERSVAENLTLPELILAIVSTPAFRSPGRMEEVSQ